MKIALLSHRALRGMLPRGFVIGLLIMSGVVPGPLPRPVATAQTAAPQSAGAEGTWQGTLHPPGHDLRTVLKVTKAANGALSAQFFSIDQSPEPLPVSSISFSGGAFRYAITGFDLSYEGKMSPDGNTIVGTSTQGGNTLPLNFERATPGHGLGDADAASADETDARECAPEL